MDGKYFISFLNRDKRKKNKKNMESNDKQNKSCTDTNKLCNEILTNFCKCAYAYNKDGLCYKCGLEYKTFDNDYFIGNINIGKYDDSDSDSDSYDSDDSDDSCNLNNIDNKYKHDANNSKLICLKSKYTHITDNDLNSCANSYARNKILDAELQDLYFYKKTNHQSMTNAAKTKCVCCTNYIVIHEANVHKFIIKYMDKPNNSIISSKQNYASQKMKPSSKLITILYRLHPNIFSSYDMSKIKCLSKINRLNHISQDSYEHIFENYFHTNDNLVLSGEYETCSVCEFIFCHSHSMYNPFFRFKCAYCDKYWNICTWCLNAKVRNFYSNISNELTFAHALCNIFHKE